MFFNRGIAVGSGRLDLAGGGGGGPTPLPEIAGNELMLGMRKMRSAYAGSAVRIRRSSDDSEQDFGFDSNGNLDTASIATFVGAGSGYVVTWYDQSGNGNDFTQATTTKQPLYVASGINNKPTMRFDGSDDNLRCGTNFSSSTAGSLFAIYQLTSSLATNQTLFSSADEASTSYFWFAEAYASANPYISMQQRSNDTAQWILGDTATTDSTVYVSTWKSNGTAYEFRLNGIAQTESVSSGTDNGDWIGDTANRDSFTIGILKRTSEALALKGDVSEIVLYDSSLSAGNTESVETNIRDAYSKSWWSGAPATVGTADNAVAPYGNKLYSFGGYDNTVTTVHNDTQIYDPSTDSWSAGTDMPTSRWGAAAAEYNGYIYVFGGAINAAGDRTGKCERYNVSGDSWDTMTDLPAGWSSQGLMAVTVGTKIYLFYLTYTYEFDPAGNGGLGSYTAKTDAPVSRTWATAAYVSVGGEDRVYLIGGAAGGASTGTDVNYYYRPTENDWSSAQTAAPYAAWGVLRENPTHNGLIYYGFGQQPADTYHNKLYAYDPSTDSWSSALQRGTVLRDGMGCAVINGKLYVVGGRANGTGFDYNEFYGLT